MSESLAFCSHCGQCFDENDLQHRWHPTKRESIVLCDQCVDLPLYAEWL